MPELRAVFHKAGDGLKVQLHGGGRTGEPVPFAAALSEAEYEDLRWYLEDYMDLPDGGSVVRAERVEAALGPWGRRLFDALFGSGDHREMLTDLLDERQPPPRLLTIATLDPDLLRLPWELIRDDAGPLSRGGVTVRRQLERAGRAKSFKVELPLRLLLIVSRPADLSFIDPRFTTRAVLDALEPLERNVRIDFCRPPTLARMEEMLAAAAAHGEPYHVVHFDGHGTFLPELGLGALCFERPDGPGTDHVRADRLGNLLKAHRIPLAILEACRSGQIGRVPAFRSVAPRLIEAGVGSALAMSHAVHVEATRVLLERFYQDLVAGATIGQALEAGRGALIANPYRWLERGPGGRSLELVDWFLPTLYQQGEDLRLVPPGAAARRAAKEVEHAGAGVDVGSAVPGSGDRWRWDVFLSHTHDDSGRVEALARELRDRHGLRVFLDKWEIKSGPLHEQCREAIRASRFVLLAVSRRSLASDWVAAEHDMARAIDPRGRNVIPLVYETVELPPDLQALLWYDLRDPAQDEENTRKIAETVRAKPGAGGGTGAAQVTGARREPAAGEEPGAFPRPPLYQFHGRAAELYRLERELRGHRAVLLHAMGGMGKTTLAREAAFWWTRTGLFPDGSCFLSFERGAGAEQAVRVLGSYLEGHAFEALPPEEQRKRARRLFEERQVLIVWDNFESVLPAFQQGEATPLYPQEKRAEIYELFRDWTEKPGGKGRLLVTCRPEEAGLPGAVRVELAGLARPDALHLLARSARCGGSIWRTHGSTGRS